MKVRKPTTSWLTGLSVILAACTGAQQTQGTPAATTEPLTTASVAATSPDASLVGDGPTPRGYSVMVDVPGAGVLMVGGQDAPPPSGRWLYEMWMYRSDSGWERLMPTCDLADCTDGVPDHAGPFAYDPSSNSGLMVGEGGETWSFDMTTATWTQRQTGPSGRLGAALAYDQQSARYVLFGGLDLNSFSVNDETWVYDPATDTWAQMSPESSPGAGNFHLMSYDADSDRVILTGGGDRADVALEGTWAYDYEADSWTELSPAAPPSARYYSAMVYDTDRDRMVIFGGTDRWAVATFDDTWVYDYDSNRWTELTASGPSVRAWHAMAYDESSQTVVTFGGGLTRDDVTAETWLFDATSEAWSLRP